VNACWRVWWKERPLGREDERRDEGERGDFSSGALVSDCPLLRAVLHHYRRHHRTLSSSPSSLSPPLSLSSSVSFLLFPSPFSFFLSRSLSSCFLSYSTLYLSRSPVAPLRSNRFRALRFSAWRRGTVSSRTLEAIIACPRNSQSGTRRDEIDKKNRGGRTRPYHFRGVGIDK